LIFNELVKQRFFRYSSQALDFSGLAAHGAQAINKVIHTKREAWVNCCQIKDLRGLSEIHLNFTR
jgi:hypothetical protein